MQRFRVGDRVRVSYRGRTGTADIGAGAPVEREGPIVAVIAPGEIPDMCWYQREGSGWSDSVKTPFGTGPARACGVYRYVLRVDAGRYHVIPDQAIDDPVLGRLGLEYSAEIVPQ